jgi:hypothetical protein
VVSANRRIAGVAGHFTIHDLLSRADRAGEKEVGKYTGRRSHGGWSRIDTRTLFALVVSEHYAKNRFTIPNLHATVVNRMVSGNKVVDHERIVGLGVEVVEVIAIYEVEGSRIRKVWLF